ncbi:MAG TPA: hypothetical protein VFF65_10575 [Phycisphaerales bacterium]|nr:hypothetical protein [Phycisphaerales bacterium]
MIPPRFVSAAELRRWLDRYATALVKLLDRGDSPDRARSEAQRSADELTTPRTVRRDTRERPPERERRRWPGRRRDRDNRSHDGDDLS